MNEKDDLKLAKLKAAAQKATDEWTDEQYKDLGTDFSKADAARAANLRLSRYIDSLPRNEGDWPKPNSDGVYTDFKSHELITQRMPSSSFATASIYALQIGENQWIASWFYKGFRVPGNGSTLTVDSVGVHKTSDEALQAAKQALKDDVEANKNSMKPIVYKPLLAWLN